MPSQPPPTQSRKFLFVSANQGGGGSEELWVQTAGHLKNLGHEVLAITEWKAGAARRLKQLAEMRVPHRSADPQGKAALLNKVWERVTRGEPWRIKHLKAQIRALSPDLVIFNSGTLVDGIPLLEAIHEVHPKCVAVTHLVSTDNWPDDALAERIHRSYHKAVEACFVSAHNRDLCARQVGRRLVNATLVRNPFLVTGEMPPMPKLTSEGVVKLALPARLHPKTKGHDMLFEVLARPEWQARQVQVSLLGHGGCERTLRHLAEELQLGQKVHFAGHVNDMNAVWREHHALILPSRHEGLPIAQIEAMWAGRAVIATPAGGIPEMLEHGRTGFLARACDTEALHEVLEEAWQRRAEWESLGAAGRELAQSCVPTDPVKLWAEHLLSLTSAAR